AVQGPVLAHRSEDDLAHLRPGRGAAQRLRDLGQKLAVEPWRGHGDAGGRERAAVLQERADEAILVRPVDPEMIGDLHRFPAVFRGDPIRACWTGEPLSSNPGAMIAEQKSQPLSRPARDAGGGGDFWSAGALLIAAFVVMPVTAVLVLAFHPTENIWPHLLATTLPRYAANTAILTLGTGALAAAVGTGAAWIVTMYRFPFSGVLEWLLLMPLAIPAYIGAYALVDFLDYSGPVQVALREAMGWTSARDYWFPAVRSRPGAVLVLAAALYPYVYMLARAAFREQSAGSYEVARALGAGPVGLFLRVGLPLARPAIAAGAAIVMMETVNDFGVVDFFAVQTLTTGIFTVWLETGNAGGAAQIAAVILAVILALVALEKVSRRNSRYYQSARQPRPVTKVRLSGPAAALAAILCALPVAFGFVLPLAVIAGHALDKPETWFSAGLGRAFLNTLTVGGGAAFLTVAGAVFMVYGVRLTGRRLPKIVLPVTTIGYAAPGAVL